MISLKDRRILKRASCIIVILNPKNAKSFDIIAYALRHGFWIEMMDADLKGFKVHLYNHKYLYQKVTFDEAWEEIKNKNKKTKRVMEKAEAIANAQLEKENNYANAIKKKV